MEMEILPSHCECHHGHILLIYGPNIPRAAPLWNRQRLSNLVILSIDALHSHWGKMAKYMYETHPGGNG